MSQHPSKPRAHRHSRGLPWDGDIFGVRGWEDGAVGRASRARRAARKAAKGGPAVAAGLVGLGAIGYGVPFTEAKIDRRTVGTPFEPARRADRLYDEHGRAADHSP